MARKTFKVVELFAGVGGFRIGLEKNGWEVVFGNQWEPGKNVQHAYDCYISHFKKGIHLNDNISLVPLDKIPSHDLLVGGFPCQDYSVASTLANSKGIQGKKGVLWWEINKIVESKKPKFILLENVDRLLKSPAKQRGRDFCIILACLNSLGYSVEWRVINAAEYGEIQRRRRTFIFATKEKKIINKLYNGSDESVLNNKGFFASTFPVQKEFKGKIKSYDIPSDLLQVSDSFTALFENSGYCYDFKCITAKTVVDYKGPFKLLRDILVDNPDEKYYLSKEKIEKFNYLKGSKHIKRKAKNGHEYTYSEGPIANPDYLDRAARTMLTSEGSVNRSTHIIKDPITNRTRILTPIECERLNGFPDDWTLTGMTERTRYFCMGNALVIPLIEKMGLAIKKLM